MSARPGSFEPMLYAAVLLMPAPALAAAVPESGATEISDVRAAVDQALHWIAMVIEVIGVGVIVVGAALASAAFVRNGLGAEGWDKAYQDYRANLGRAILLGLELLVAADIIGTVAVTPSFQTLGVLAFIVLIRTFLSFALEVEMEGHWPWRRREAERGSAAAAHH
ncbi:MAG TPA: DUF1622 domain-containing protein [Microvirga sp.]|jgi:uncharacterized membrane protein|nr:DUF1622 domain-containing protein [Microvirga sp.]